MKKIFSLIFLIANTNVMADNILSNKNHQISIANFQDTAAYSIANINSINLPFYYNKPINTFLADLADRKSEENKVTKMYPDQILFNQRYSISANAGNFTAYFPRRCMEIEDTQIFGDLIPLINGQSYSMIWKLYSRFFPQI